MQYVFLFFDAMFLSLFQPPGSSYSRIIPASYACWTFGDAWLPEEFFLSDSSHPDNVVTFYNWVKDGSWKGHLPNSVAPAEFIERVLLGLGLGLRQLNEVLFTEPDCMAADMPKYCLDVELKAWDAMTQAAAYLSAAVKK